MGSCNFGSFKKRVRGKISALFEHDPHLAILAVCETWATKRSDATIAKFHQTTGLEMISIPRPPTPNEKSNNVGGGIAVIYRKNLQVELSGFAPEGAALLKVTPRQLSPFNFMVGYPPPTSSKYSDHRKVVFDFFRTHLQDSHPLPCVLAGDLNTRLHTMSGTRFTEDDEVPMDRESRALADILNESNQSPIAGRTIATKALFTSKSAAGTGAAESDYICSASLEDTPYLPPTPPIPDAQTKKKNEHTPIFASIKLHQITPIPQPPQAERPPKISIPPYNATEIWEEIANSQQLSISDVSLSISQPGSTVQSLYEDIHQFLRQPVVDHLTRDPHPLSTDTIERSFKGKLLPPDMLELRDRVSAALKRASRTGSKLKKAAEPAREPLITEYKRLRDEHKSLKELFNNRSDEFFRTLSNTTFPAAFRHNSSPIFKLLKDGSSGVTSTASHRIPDKDGRPAQEWFGEEAAAELDKVPEPPGITSHKEFQDHIPRPPPPRPPRSDQ